MGPVMGTPDTAPDSYSVMRALQGTQAGKTLTASRLRVYGWINSSAYVSTSHNTNIPLSYAIDSNSIHLDQVIVRIERGLVTSCEAIWIGDLYSRTCMGSIIDGPYRRGS